MTEQDIQCPLLACSHMCTGVYIRSHMYPRTRNIRMIHQTHLSHRIPTLSLILVFEDTLINTNTNKIIGCYPSRHLPLWWSMNWRRLPRYGIKPIPRWVFGIPGKHTKTMLWMDILQFTRTVRWKWYHQSEKARLVHFETFPELWTLME